MTIGGHCDPRFERVREEFERNFAEWDELGASVCVIVDGEAVVDLLGRHRRPRQPPALERGHRASDLLLHQGRRGPVREYARRPRPARPEPARRRLLAAVRQEWQGGDTGTTGLQPPVRRLPLGTDAARRRECATGPS